MTETALRRYASLRKAIEGAEGELIITTEGLLMYLTQAELETVFDNIRRLLLEFGGEWITVDNELAKAEKGALAAVTTGMPQALAEKIGSIAAGALAKTTLNNNIFFDRDPEKAKKFVSDMGFELELVPMGRYMPETIVAYKQLPEDLRTQLRKALDSDQNISLVNMNDSVREIIETTVFDTILC